MHHHRPVRLVILADIFQFKSLRQIKIPLHGPQLPQTADGIFDLEIDLGSIESGFTFHALVLNSARLKPGCQCFFSFLPLLVCTKIQLAPIASLHRKFKLDFVEAERLQDLVSKINAIVDLARNLFRSAEQMSIVDSESPDAHQSMESSRQFGAIDGSHLGITLREIAIRTLLRFVNPDVHWAVHRLKTKLSLFQFGGREHRIAVVLFVAAQLPKLTPGNVRRVNKTVVPFGELLAQIVVHLLAHDAALRMPEHETLSVLLMN